MPVVSIIICTRDNADNLRLTLEAIGRCTLPADLPAELLVVDNGSTGQTRDVVNSIGMRGTAVRCIRESRLGKGFAYNAALAAAQGDVLLFTDDDTRPPQDWVPGMCTPIARDDTDAVAGSVVIPPHLQRPWMTSIHRSWLASTESIESENSWRMVGANMAFSRRVLHRVTAFDTELGPGALGFEDETLFSRQIVAAGLRTATAWEIKVEHWFDPDRLTPAAFRAMAEKLGRSTAYVEHHWIHYHRSLPKIRWAKHFAQLAAWNCFHRPGFDERGLELSRQTALYAQAVIEQGRPRNYARHGLSRLPVSMPEDPVAFSDTSVHAGANSR